MENLEFIKNVKSVDVDGLRGINTYTIMAMYNKIEKDSSGFEFATIVHKTIDKFTMTWDEITRDGGIGQVNQDLKECYNLEK